MTNPLFIKVCGLKDELNINDVDALGVDYIGMIFYEKSPRYVGENTLHLKTIKAKKVGVFVNASLEYIKQIKTEFNIQTAQLHGAESPEFSEKVKNTGLEVWKVFGIDDEFDFSMLDNYPSVDLFLFDTKSPLHGGTGIKFNWEKLSSLNNKIKFMLSGGIGKDDAAAINKLSIQGLVGIDLNSKFETAPGHKNAPMLKDFIQQLKQNKQ